MVLARAPRLAVVVEDEPVLLMDVTDLLEQAGFTVLEATHASGALAHLEARPDVALLFADIHMPGAMDGLALARTVAARWPQVAILVCSAFAAPTVADLPADARFISRPFSPEVLRRMLFDLGLTA